MRLTEAWRRFRVDWRVVHDDDEKHGERQQHGDSQRDLLTRARRQPEDTQRNNCHQHNWQDDVVGVVENLRAEHPLYAMFIRLKEYYYVDTKSINQ